MSVCLSVRVCVCSLLRYRLNVFLPPLPEVRCPKILKILNPSWGKVVERSGARFEHFCSKMVKNRRRKKSFSYGFFCICSLLRYRLNVFLPPFHEVGCPKLLEIQNPCGKVFERSGLRFEYFCSKIV